MDLIADFMGHSGCFILRHLWSLQFMIQNTLELQNLHCLKSITWYFYNLAPLPYSLPHGLCLEIQIFWVLSEDQAPVKTQLTQKPRRKYSHLHFLQACCLIPFLAPGVRAKLVFRTAQTHHHLPHSSVEAYSYPMGAQSTKLGSIMGGNRRMWCAQVVCWWVEGEKQMFGHLVCSKSKPWTVSTHSSHFPKLVCHLLLASLPPSPTPGHACPGSTISVWVLVTQTIHRWCGAPLNINIWLTWNLYHPGSPITFSHI